MTRSKDKIHTAQIAKLRQLQRSIEWVQEQTVKLFLHPLKADSTKALRQLILKGQEVTAVQLAQVTEIERHFDYLHRRVEKQREAINRAVKLAAQAPPEACYPLDARQHATVLAALRYYQFSGLYGVPANEPIGGRPANEVIADLATNGGTLRPLSDLEIDALCESLNF